MWSQGCVDALGAGELAQKRKVDRGVGRKSIRVAYEQAQMRIEESLDGPCSVQKLSRGAVDARQRKGSARCVKETRLNKESLEGTSGPQTRRPCSSDK